MLRVIEILKEEFGTLSEKMWNYSRILRASLINSGYELTKGTAPIVSICSGNSVETLKMTKSIFNEGILTTPFIYPSVQEKGGRIRIIAGANLKEDSIRKACIVFEKIKDEYR